MVISDNRRPNRPALFIVMMLAILMGVAGCATTRSGRQGDMLVKVLWEAGDQYVAIEKQDRQTDTPVAPNSHPATVSDDRLRSMLESIEVRLPDENKAIRLFNENEITILTANIRTGLASARPDEDVTFAIIGHYPVLMGLVNEREVTTGRAYCRDGQLNIIFGDVHRTVKENEDRRLNPFVPGSRGTAAPGKWSLKATSGGEQFAVKRADWVAFPLEGPTVPAAAPAVRHDAGTAGTGDKAVPPAVPGQPGKSGKATFEERLRTLDDLHDKKLITDEEYRAKRRDILNEL
ncbi:MAG TPA: SHOCT domain-containing protein [Geobacteraceae bacterium]|nr:SHOCT domain-containing protein [Geobacteraceae bacterium]